ncbi:MAG TPA: hypothetical protein VGS80_21000 [Ktedonobacterales bacterium]|nr:hypothetical protein [Ktedonobacterales bacterium]
MAETCRQRLGVAERGGEPDAGDELAERGELVGVYLRGHEPRRVGDPTPGDRDVAVAASAATLLAPSGAAASG